MPNAATQEQCGLLRTRKQLTRERTSHVQRLQRTLEEANIKLDSVITDIMGLSGRRMIEAMLKGATLSQAMAEYPGSEGAATPAAGAGASGTPQATAQPVGGASAGTTYYTPTEEGSGSEGSGPGGLLLNYLLGG